MLMIIIKIKDVLLVRSLCENFSLSMYFFDQCEVILKIFFLSKKMDAFASNSKWNKLAYLLN